MTAREAIPEPYRGGYANNPRLAGALANGIATELDKRLPEETLTPDQLTGDHTINGPRIVVLVDDYDIIATGGQQPLAPFLPYLASAADIGLHFVVTRRVAGASHALHEYTAEPVPQPWSRTQLTTSVRGRAPRPTLLITVGHPDRPAQASTRITRTIEGSKKTPPLYWATPRTSPCLSTPCSISPTASPPTTAWSPH